MGEEGAEPRRSPGSPTSLADCSEAVCAALRQLQEGYATAQAAVQQLQEEKAALRADARSMAERLFCELRGSQERVAELTAEVEQLRQLQGELAEAAAAEAESCRATAAAAVAAKAEALGRVAALEREVEHARQAAHSVEVAAQDERARALVEREGLASQMERLQLQLGSAEAGAAAKQQMAELWQRKHAVAEAQVAELHAALQAERSAKQELTQALEVSQRQAQQQQSEADAYRKAAAAALHDLAELCSALQTAQAAMAVDSGTRPEYLQALALIHASLQRVAAAKEAALAAVAGAAVGNGCQGAASLAGASLMEPQLQQQVLGLLHPYAQAAALLGPVPSAEQGMAAAGGTAAEAGGPPAAASPTGAPPSPAGLATAQLALAHVGEAGSVALDQPGEAAGEGVPAAQRPPPEQQQNEQQCSPAAAAPEAAAAPASAGGAKEAQHSPPGASAQQQPSAFLQAFRAQHRRGAPLASITQAPGCASPEQRSPSAATPKAAAVDSSSPNKSTALQCGAAPVEAAAEPAVPHCLPKQSPRSSQPALGPPASSLAPLPGRRRTTAAGAGLCSVGALVPGSAAAASTRDSLTAVIMAVEDEMATLDLRHAALLRQSAQLAEARAPPGDPTLGLEREEVAGVVRGVRDAMRRKGEQLRQLRQYRDALGAAAR